VILALAEAGATNSEMSELTLAAFNVNAGVVELPGSLRVDPRRNLCTPWGAQVFAGRLHRYEPEALMIPNADGRRASSSSISQHFHQLASFAALARRRYTVNSVRAWRALEIAREQQTVEAAARFLGIRSLDTAATMIGWEWRP
jgi:integrase/recombinase XerC